MEIAAIQFEVNDSDSRAKRFEKVESIFCEIGCQSAKPDLILLPETWGCGYFDFDNYRKYAEPLAGETYEFIAAWAKKLDTFILGGSFIEADGNDLFNTSILINKQGELIAHYRKIHLFGYQSREPQLIKRGSAPVVIETELGVIGLSTCYDLRFPEQYREMIDLGAEVFLVVSAWPINRIAHWRLFNQARALENQSWLVSCNCCGNHRGWVYGGNSMTISPMGEIVAEAGLEPCILRSSADVALVDEYRQGYPALADRIK